jgi:hypothetical protein
VDEAEEAERSCEDEQKAFEAAEFDLYRAVLAWRQVRGER